MYQKTVALSLGVSWVIILYSLYGNLTVRVL